jgi:glutathione peroxidase
MRASFAALLVGLFAILSFASVSFAGAPVMRLYDLQTHTLDGKPADLSAYKGKVALVVNLASKCGFTPQYTALEALYERNAGRGFVILGFPSNEFGGQEPGTSEEIQSFCKLNYGVTFPLFEKSVTKPGAGQSPVYGFLTSGGDAPAWNFGKYLIGKDGRVVRYFPSKVTPEDPALVAAIEAELAK